jgi:hypothetical protein
MAPDTILTLVNGKEDEAFLPYLWKNPYWSRTFIYDYFFERNQLFIRQYRPEGDEINKYAHLFNGRDIRFILDYQSRPYKPVGQFTPDELKARRLAYLLRCYQEGENSRNYGGMLAPDLFDTPAEERLFGLLGVKYWQGNRFERFGHVSRDSRGTYIPLERHMQFKVQDQIWEENGEWLGMEDDERFNAVIKELDEAANGASSSLVEPGDSVVAMAFIYGGKVAKGALHESDVMWEKPFKDKVKGRIFEFTPGFCHAKMSIVDDLMATCGTINLDYRSLYHHFENGCLYADCDAVMDTKKDFEETFAQCREVTDHYVSGRGAFLRLGQLNLRLFAALM